MLKLSNRDFLKANSILSKPYLSSAYLALDNASAAEADFKQRLAIYKQHLIAMVTL